MEISMRAETTRTDSRSRRWSIAVVNHRRTVSLAVLTAFTLPVGAGTSLAANADQPDPPYHVYNTNSGLCLNVKSYSQAPGAPTEIWYCNSNPAQRWVHRSDGTLYNPNSGQCLNVKSYSTSAGAPTQLWPCNGNRAMVWQWRSDRTLYNPNSGLCLNVKSYSTSAGAPTQLWYCNGNPAQRWVPFTPPSA
jgi:hypothetical protein